VSRPDLPCDGTCARIKRRHALRRMNFGSCGRSRWSCSCRAERSGAYERNQ
jgi:hypothetical protein